MAASALTAQRPAPKIRPSLGAAERQPPPAPTPSWFFDDGLPDSLWETAPVARASTSAKPAPSAMAPTAPSSSIRLKDVGLIERFR
jgi:hypothetical protein